MWMERSKRNCASTRRSNYEIKFNLKSINSTVFTAFRLVKSLLLPYSLHFWTAARTCCLPMFCTTTHTIVIHWISSEWWGKWAKHTHTSSHFFHHSLSHVEVEQNENSNNYHKGIRKWYKHRYSNAYPQRYPYPQHLLHKELLIIHLLSYNLIKQDY